jgi:tetratricopeptide (TPR) repeat protein
MPPPDRRRAAALLALGGAVLAILAFALRDLRRATAPRPVCRVAVPALAAGDPGAAALGDGLTAALAAQLGGIRGVAAAGPADLAAGDRGPFDLRLQGRLRAAGPRLDVEATWLDGAGRARRTLRLAASRERIFDLQERLALATAGLCGIQPSFAERRALARGLAESLPAYDLYLRARALLDGAAPPPAGAAAPAAAASLLRQATELDPEFALAHAALADALVVSGRPATAVQEAELARELDDHLPAIHWALIRADRAAGRPEAAALELRRLLSLRPEVAAARRALRRRDGCATSHPSNPL